MISVCLPNHASRISWLAMESLCRQITTEQWELIVYEDSDIYLGGKQFYLDYLPRLKEAGCVRLHYKYSEERIPLSRKWKEMAQMASSDSLGLILQASDCYSEPMRINTAITVFKRGFDWIQSPQGVFYNWKTGQTMLFKKLGAGTALNMAISLRCALMLDDTERWSCVDWWLYNSLPDDATVWTDNSTNWMNGVDTDGHNRISTERKLFYNKPQHPFYHTKITLSDVVPYDIFERIKGL